jgi:hypothetical protein
VDHRDGELGDDAKDQNDRRFEFVGTIASEPQPARASFAGSDGFDAGARWPD